MSVILHRITYLDGDLGGEGLPAQEWFPTHAKAMTAIRIRQDQDGDFSAVIEAFDVGTGARQLCDWLNKNCGMAKAVTPGPCSKVGVSRYTSY